MSFLLGSESCVGRLKDDLREVEESVSGVRTCIKEGGGWLSWKYPGRCAEEVNISDVLGNAHYDGTDHEGNMVTHVVLLELIIDRFYFMFQIHCEFIDQILNKTNQKSVIEKLNRSTTQRTISPCLGLISKKHWNKMTQLSIYMDNLQKENLQQKNINKELLLEIEKLKKENNSKEISFNLESISKNASDWLQSIDNECMSLKSSKKTISGQISKDVVFKSSQTLDTAFKPCESCHVSQTCFRESSYVLMEILKEESQTSSLVKLNQDLRSLEWLSDAKMLQLKESFIKDFDKVCMLYKDIRKKERKVNEELNASEKFCDQLTQEVSLLKEQMKKERNDLHNQRKQLESQIEVQTKSLKSTQAEIHTITNDFNSKYKQLQNDLVELNAELIEKDKDRRILEKLKLSLMDLQFKADDPIKTVSSIKEKMEQQRQQIDSLNNTIHNQMTVNNNLSEIEKIANEKENKLIKRLQNLSDQKHKLDEKIDLLEEKLEIANSTIKEIENEKTSISLQVKEKIAIIENLVKTKEDCDKKIIQLQNQISNMESTALEIEKEKQLLIHYPDLGGPLEKYDSGDVSTDIEMQIKANAVRIKILSKQNNDLGNALNKLQLKAYQCPESPSIQNITEFLTPVDMVSVSKESNLKLHIKPVSAMSSTSHSTSRQKPPRPSSSTKLKSVDSPNQMLQWSTTTQKSVTAAPIVCGTCGRQYPQKSDLEIHKEYCAGRRRKINQNANI